MAGGDQPIIEKGAGAFERGITFSEEGFDLATAADLTSLGRTFDRWWLRKLVGTMDRLRGGIWVGGRLSLYVDRFEFTPNALNQRLSAGSYQLSIPLAAVSAVRTRFGLFTRIIEITQTDGTVSSVRCYDAKSVAMKILSAASAAGAAISR